MGSSGDVRGSADIIPVEEVRLVSHRLLHLPERIAPVSTEAVEGPERSERAPFVPVQWCTRVSRSASEPKGRSARAWMSASARWRFSPLTTHNPSRTELSASRSATPL